MTNSDLKGKVAERELAKKLRRLFPWCKARRRQQFSGTEGTDDVKFIEGVHVECKRVEKLNLGAAMRKAERDCGDSIPIVCHRRNGAPWFVTIKLDDWPKLREQMAAVELEETRPRL